MTSLAPSWDLVRVRGTWLTNDLQALRAGTYKVDIPRATVTSDDAIVPAGTYASGQLATTAGAPSLDIQVPLPGDPDLREAVKVTVTVTPANAPAETYVLDGPAPDGGYDLARIVPSVGGGGPTAASLKVGLPGGVARLDLNGDVVDAEGNPVKGSGGGTVDDAALASRNLPVLTDLNPLAAALASVDTSPVDIYVLGDSVSEGMGATSVAKTWPSRLVSQLRALYPVAEGGATWVPVFWDSDSLPHSSWVFTGGVADSYGVGIGQRYIILDGTKTASLTFTGTRVSIFHVTGDGIGFGKYRIDGGAWTQFSPGSGAFHSTGVVPIDVTRGTHTLDIAWDGGNGVYIEGAAVYDGDEAKGIRLWNGSKYGSTTKEWADWSAGFPYFDDRLRIIKPAVFVLQTVLNDIGNKVPVADFKAAYDALITRVTANVPGVSIPCIIPPVPLAELSTRPGVGNPEDYFAALREVVAAHPNAFVVDARAWFPDLPVNASDPLDLWYSDNTHPSDRGHSLLANRIAHAFSAGLRAVAPRALSAADRGAPNGLATLDSTGKMPASQVAQVVLDRLQSLEDAPAPADPPTPAVTQAFDFTGASMTSGSATKLWRVPMTGKLDVLFTQQDAAGAVDTILDVERFNSGTSAFDSLYVTKPKVTAGSLLSQSPPPSTSAVSEGDLLRLRLLQAPPSAVPSTAPGARVSSLPYGDGTTIKTSNTHPVQMPSGGAAGDTILVFIANGVLSSPLPTGFKSLSSMTTTPNARIPFTILGAAWTSSLEAAVVNFGFTSGTALLADPVLLRNVSLDNIGQVVYSDGVEQVGGADTATPAFTASADADLVIKFAASHFPASVDGYRPEFVPTQLPRVTRSGSSLKVNGVTTRFAGTNAYWLALNDNKRDGNGAATIPTAQDVRDTLDALVGMGGTMVRVHSAGINYGNAEGKSTNNALMPTLGTYNETAFVAIDRIFAEAAKRGLYVIVPFADRWNYYHGGGVTFARLALNNTTATLNDFYTNATVKSEFKKYLTAWFSRVNTITGVAYKDDTTLAIAELGNEMYDAPAAWTSEMAAHVKSIAPNVLVADPTAASGKPVTDSNVALSDANVDVFGLHAYPRITSAVSTARAAIVAAGKVCMLGEYDWTTTPQDGVSNSGSTATPAEWLSMIEGDSGIAVSLWWTLLVPNAGAHRDGYELVVPGENATQTDGYAYLKAHQLKVNANSLPVPRVPTNVDRAMTNLGSTSFDWTFLLGISPAVASGASVAATKVALRGGTGSTTNASHLTGAIAVRRKPGTVGPSFITPLLTIKAV